MSFGVDGAALDSVTEKVREKYCPKWPEQMDRHLRGLGLKGPVALGAREIIKKSLAFKGIEMKKRRRRLG